MFVSFGRYRKDGRPWDITGHTRKRDGTDEFVYTLLIATGDGNTVGVTFESAVDMDAFVTAIKNAAFEMDVETGRTIPR